MHKALLGVRDAAYSAKRRLDDIRIDPPSWSLTQLFFLIAAIFVGAMVWRWWISAACNAGWRERIAASSAAVRAELAKGARKVTDLDAIIIRTLGEQDAQLKVAVEQLRAANATHPAAGDRCTVARSCLGGLR